LRNIFVSLSEKHVPPAIVVVNTKVDKRVASLEELAPHNIAREICVTLFVLIDQTRLRYDWLVMAVHVGAVRVDLTNAKP